MDNDEAIKSTPLLDRIYAALLAGAIGDALGGPIEGWSYEQIVDMYGVVDTLLPYTQPPDYHNHFASAPGTVTDDTRLKHILCQAIIARGALPQRGDLIRACVQAYYGADSELERGFLEEYVLGGLYGNAKLIWGGQMTNGFVMCNAPLGLICPCDPETAFALSYAVDFISTGYARYTAALAAAAVAAAFRPGITPVAVVDAALDAASAHRIEGTLTRGWQWYARVFELNERLIKTAVDLALHYQDVFKVRAEYYARLRVSPLGSEAAQTLAVALGMWVAAGGDVRQTLIGCVNYGRDNDSYAAVGGALAGAWQGTRALPPEWCATVVKANPDIDMRSLALGLTGIALQRQRKMRAIISEMEYLLEVDEGG